MAGVGKCSLSTLKPVLGCQSDREPSGSSMVPPIDIWRAYLARLLQAPRSPVSRPQSSEADPSPWEREVCSAKVPRRSCLFSPKLMRQEAQSLAARRVLTRSLPRRRQLGGIASAFLARDCGWYDMERTGEAKLNRAWNILAVHRCNWER
jgi:hypothetical protein